LNTSTERPTKLTSKQRAALRAVGHSLEPILFVGKAGVTESTVLQAEEALEAREIIKGSVQQNAGLSARDVCATLAERCDAEPVAAVGRKFVLYRASKKNPRLKL
jgi:RNA-binding protein